MISAKWVDTVDGSMFPLLSTVKKEKVYIKDRGKNIDPIDPRPKAHKSCWISGGRHLRHTDRVSTQDVGAAIHIAYAH